MLPRKAEITKERARGDKDIHKYLMQQRSMLLNYWQHLCMVCLQAQLINGLV